MVGQDDGCFARTQGFDDLFDPLYAGRRGFSFAANPACLHHFVYCFNFRRFIHGG